MLSATTLARILGIAVKNAIRILIALVKDEIAIEVAHRAKRRLFALQGLAPLHHVLQPPYAPTQAGAAAGRATRSRMRRRKKRRRRCRR